MKVYKVISQVAAELSAIGISKTGENRQQGYAFRGIDAVMNAMSPILVKYGLVILPRCVSRVTAERVTKSGGVLFYTTVEAEFDFVAVEDGSKHTIKTYGEAMDSADKSTNKAMSAAYKYAAFQAFCIPTEGSDDADNYTHEVRGSVEPKNVQKAKDSVRDRLILACEPIAQAAPFSYSEVLTLAKTSPDLASAEIAVNTARTEARKKLNEMVKVAMKEKNIDKPGLDEKSKSAYPNVSKWEELTLEQAFHVYGEIK